MTENWQTEKFIENVLFSQLVEVILQINFENYGEQSLH